LPKKKNDLSPIPGIRLKQAMEKGLAIVGPAALQGIFEDLERRGIKIEVDAACSAERLDAILREIFGEDASNLMMTKIYRELESDWHVP
jgi:hypothetical protein